MTFAYARSAHDLRRDRTRDALRDVGFSVTSGLVTTILSCILMLFATTSFFITFAKAVFGTLGFAYGWGVIAMPAMFSLIGPQYEIGSLMPLFRACCPCCCGTEHKYKA